MQFVIAISLPMSAGMILTAPYLIHLFCGETYAPAKYTLQIIAPIIIVIGIAYVVGYQILYPQGKEKIIIQSTAIGAIANFLLNLWLIPRYAHNGAAISTIITESIVTISMISFGSKYIPIQWKNKHYLHYTIGTTLMIIGIWGLEYSSSSSIVNLLLSCCIGIIIYTIYLISIKDSFYLEIKNIIAQS
jgi:O-antigen/teichoic acid export membrane protein